MIIHTSIDSKAIDENDVLKILSRSISDPTFPDVDFKNKMAWVWTTLKTEIMKIDEIESFCQNFAQQWLRLLIITHYARYATYI